VTSIFINGPCAEIAPAIIDKVSGEEFRIGRIIGETAARAIAVIRPEPIGKLEDHTREIILPVRQDLPETDEEEIMIKGAENFLAESNHMPMPDIKKLAENLQFLRTAGFLRKNGSMVDLRNCGDKGM